ncbi:hypothetical protein C8R43DRAFT_1136604 [Mycena crocata]|nr:hypothetical protein C8R43DRAFT_1136604 [Mycena crocata]
MSTPLSLFDELTRQIDLRFPVTELLGNLLRTVGHDVCLTKRNLHSSYWTVSRARDVCDQINTLAARAGDGDSWEIFDKYTAMIVTLEKILMDFLPVAETESAATKLPAAITIQEDLKFIDSWRLNRTALHDIAQKLIDSEHFRGDNSADSSSEIKAIQRHDDNVLLQTFSSALLHHEVELIKNIPLAKQYVGTIRKQLAGIQTMLAAAPETLDNGVRVYSIQTAMILEIVTSGRDKQLAVRLQTAETWTRAVTLVNTVEKHLKDSNLLPADLEKAWNDFRFYLEHPPAPAVDPPNLPTAVKLPDSYKNLRTLISKIRRPYYAQGVTLISGCFELAQKFNSKKTSETLLSINRAIDDITTALEKAATVGYDPTQSFVPETDVTSKFDVAVTSVKKCFADYKLDHASFQQRFVKARESDNTRVAQLHERFTSKPIVASVKPETIEVVVTVSNSTSRGTKPTVKTYSVEPTTMLSAILWKEASSGRPEQTNTWRNSGYFSVGTERAGLDTEVGKLPQKDGKRSVKRCTRVQP